MKNEFTGEHRHLQYVHLGIYKNPDRTVTSYGYNLRLGAFIQKVWRSKTDFSIVAIFRYKESGCVQ